jgi:acylphosphatase
MNAAVDVTVTGRVQGVSFRWYAVQEAAKLGVTGWVRNEPDGSVAGHFEGDADAVEAMVDWWREGPGPARVQRVARRDGAVTGARSFEVRY